VTDPHDDIVGNDLDTLRRETLDKAGLDEVIVDFIERFGLVVAQDDGQHDFPVGRCLLGLQNERDEKKPAEQDPFHGSTSSVRSGKTQPEREMEWRTGTPRLEGSRFAGWQALSVGSRRLPGITQRDRFAQRVWFDPVPADVLERQQPWQILGRSREPPAANLQSCHPEKRLPSRALRPPLLLIQLGFAFRGLGLVLGVIGHKMFAELSKSSGFERSPHLIHQIEIEMQVMNGDEP